MPHAVSWMYCTLLRFCPSAAHTTAAHVAGDTISERSIRVVARGCNHCNITVALSRSRTSINYDLSHTTIGAAVLHCCFVLCTLYCTLPHSYYCAHVCKCTVALCALLTVERKCAKECSSLCSANSPQLIVTERTYFIHLTAPPPFT